MKSKFGVLLLASLSLLVTMQSVVPSSAAPVCKKAGYAAIGTSDQSLTTGDALTVTFKGVGGGCKAGSFKVIVSSSSAVNSQGYLIGSISDVAIDIPTSGADNNYQRVTHTEQIVDSQTGNYYQYYFVNSAGVKVRSVIVSVVENK